MPLPPTSVHHTPLAFGAPRNAAVLNRPFGELDAAIAAVIATGSGVATTLTAQATAGTTGPFSVGSTTGLLVGDSVWFGDAGGPSENRIVATVPGGTSFTTTANLTNTYAIGKPVSKSPIEIHDARGVHPTLGARLATSLFGMLSALDYGVKADGTTDDTTACQAALDALIGSSARGVIFPAGTIRLTAALVIGSTAYQGKSILGVGERLTIFRQDTNNIPVFKTATEDTHTIEFGECHLTYNVQQTSANTGAIALNFTKPTAGIGNGWYYWNVHDIQIEKAHIAVGIGGPGATGTLVVWNCRFDRIFTTNISMTLLRLVSPGAGGMPVNRIGSWTHLGQAVANAGPAIESVGAELYFHALDIEDWYNRLLFSFGGGGITINNLHVERHHMNAAVPMIDMANDAMTIHSGTYDFAVEGGVAATLWRCGSTGSLYVHGARLICTLTSGTITGLFRASDAKTVDISGVGDDNNNVPLDSTTMPAGTPASHIGASAAAVFVVNQAYFTKFTVDGTIRVGKARIEVQTSGGAGGVGIYDEGGNRLAFTGYNAWPAAGVREIAFGGAALTVTLHPGKKYWAVIVSDSATPAVYHRASLSAAHALALGMAGDQAIGTATLPASIALALTGGARQYAIDFIP